MTISSGSFAVGPNAPKQCTAMSKRSGEQCKGPAVTNSPNQRCRMHGGQPSSIGPANASFKSGRHSRYLPAKLDELYREALSNPELLEMSDHIALLEAHLQDVLYTSSQGDPVPSWSEVTETFADVTTAVLEGNQERSNAAIEKMHNLLEAGEKWDRTWAQISGKDGILEQLRKLTDTEVKRKKELNQMVPIERVVILMAAVGEAVKRNVSNPDEIQAVYRELAMLQGSDSAPGRASIKKVGPEVIDITPKKSKAAIKRAEMEDLGAQ